jgi:hypothetical protein
MITLSVAAPSAAARGGRSLFLVLADDVDRFEEGFSMLQTLSTRWTTVGKKRKRQKIDDPIRSRCTRRERRRTKRNDALLHFAGAKHTAPLDARSPLRE